MDLVSIRIPEDHGLPGVVEGSSPLSRHHGTIAIECLEVCSVVRGDDIPSGRNIDVSKGEKGEWLAIVEPGAGEIDGGGAGIAHLNVFHIAPVPGVVHHFGNAEVVEDGIGVGGINEHHIVKRRAHALGGARGSENAPAGGGGSGRDHPGGGIYVGPFSRGIAILERKGQADSPDAQHRSPLAIIEGGQIPQRPGAGTLFYRDMGAIFQTKGITVDDSTFQGLQIEPGKKESRLPGLECQIRLQRPISCRGQRTHHPRMRRIGVDERLACIVEHLQQETPRLVLGRIPRACRIAVARFKVAQRPVGSQIRRAERFKILRVVNGDLPRQGGGDRRLIRARHCEAVNVWLREIGGRCGRCRVRDRGSRHRCVCPAMGQRSSIRIDAGGSIESQRLPQRHVHGGGRRRQSHDGCGGPGFGDGVNGRRHRVSERIQGADRQAVQPGLEDDPGQAPLHRGGPGEHGLGMSVHHQGINGGGCITKDGDGSQRSRPPTRRGDRKGSSVGVGRTATHRSVDLLLDTRPPVREPVGILPQIHPIGRGGRFLGVKPGQRPATVGTTGHLEHFCEVIIEDAARPWFGNVI